MCRMGTSLAISWSSCKDHFTYIPCSPLPLNFLEPTAIALWINFLKSNKFKRQWFFSGRNYLIHGGKIYVLRIISKKTFFSSRQTANLSSQKCPIQNNLWHTSGRNSEFITMLTGFIPKWSNKVLIKPKSSSLPNSLSISIELNM